MTSQSTATLRSRYIEQAASDLEENRHQQKELAEALARLKHEESLLVDILTLAERYEGLPEASDLPSQKRAEPYAPDGRQAPPPTQKTTRRSAHMRERRLRKAQAEADAKGKSRQPLLGEILTELLGSHSEPRLAKELREELIAKHPDRSPTPQVVRNTLESLVAKGNVQRHKQQRSVMYTLVSGAQGGVSAEAGGTEDSTS
ncbi:hypothetical protein [Streptomyces parvulus]|uniref:hypothetical protein n=1 Tax=Streptomyces parvulus TaxID=146923 RepID=UPI00340103F8